MSFSTYKRKKYARRLRAIASLPDLNWPSLMHCLDASTRGDAVRMLSELVKPEERTCRMTVQNARGNPKHFLMYVCSECHGAVIHDRYDPIYFCPNCGRKVAADD